MKKLITASALVAALCLPALANPDNGNKNGWSNPNNPHYSGVPGPLLGAGLNQLPRHHVCTGARLTGHLQHSR